VTAAPGRCLVADDHPALADQSTIAAVFEAGACRLVLKDPPLSDLVTCARDDPVGRPIHRSCSG
jgi:hypothetical protein